MIFHKVHENFTGILLLDVIAYPKVRDIKSHEIHHNYWFQIFFKQKQHSAKTVLYTLILLHFYGTFGRFVELGYPKKLGLHFIAYIYELRTLLKVV